MEEEHRVMLFFEYILKDNLQRFKITIEMLARKKLNFGHPLTRRI